MECRIWVIDSGRATAAWASHPDVISLCINVRGPMPELLEYLRWRIQHEKQQRKRQNQKQVRKRFQQYEKYLSVFDLKKAGKTRKQIAEIVFPEYRGDVEKMVSNYLSSAKRLMTRVQKGIWEND
jgi:adenylate kinase family enzyme